MAQFPTSLPRVHLETSCFHEQPTLVQGPWGHSCGRLRDTFPAPSRGPSAQEGYVAYVQLALLIKLIHKNEHITCQQPLCKTENLVTFTESYPVESYV